MINPIDSPTTESLSGAGLVLLADVALSTSWLSLALSWRTWRRLRFPSTRERFGSSEDRVCDLGAGETLAEADVAPRDRVRHPDRLLGIRAGGGERDQVVVRVG
jgi:hypothetical protein